MAHDTLAHTEVLEHAHEAEHYDVKEAWDGGTEPFKASYGKLMMWYFLLSDAFTFAGFLIAYGTLRFSMPTWPVPDYVFAKFPFVAGEAPLMFVTVMTFILIVSSVTMVRAVQEGHRDNAKGVVFWMLMTIIGGGAFLGCQAWEWTTMIGHEHVSLSANPFGRHDVDGTYTMNAEGEPYKAGEKPESFKKGQGYLLEPKIDAATGKQAVDELGHVRWIERDFKFQKDEKTQAIATIQAGPNAFGALFFFITGFHGFHVFSGLVFLAIIMLNVASGLYARRGNHYEMVEKIGLYWHFVDLVWVFVFLVFYLL